VFWVGQGHCVNPATREQVEVKLDKFIHPEAFYMCLGQLRVQNSTISSQLTFNDDNTIKTSKISFK